MACRRFTTSADRLNRYWMQNRPCHGPFCILDVRISDEKYAVHGGLGWCDWSCTDHQRRGRFAPRLPLNALDHRIIFSNNCEVAACVLLALRHIYHQRR
jgi:hypothetical protein